jgi:hypothetical protein
MIPCAAAPWPDCLAPVQALNRRALSTRVVRTVPDIEIRHQITVKSMPSGVFRINLFYSPAVAFVDRQRLYPNSMKSLARRIKERLLSLRGVT